MGGQCWASMPVFGIDGLDQLKRGIMGRPGLDACQFLVDYTKIPMKAEEVMKAMETRQEELFQKVCLNT